MASPYAIETMNGVEVRITRTAGRPLLLLTRMASGGMGIWDQIWEGLAQRFTVANFDLVGAARLDDELSPRERFFALADRSVEIAAGLGFERFHVFGWYGGAHVALACLVRHPERVETCILLDPFFELPDMRKVEKAVAFKRVLFEHPHRELYAFYWVMAGFSPAFLETNFDEVERLAKARIQADRFVSLDPERWMRWVRALRTNWLDDEEIAAVTTPTLILATELDSWHAGPTVGMAEALHRRLQASEFQVVDGLGTFFLIEAPDRFASLAEPFLRRNLGASSR